MIFHALTIDENAEITTSKILKNSILQYSDFYSIFEALSEKIIRFQIFESMVLRLTAWYTVCSFCLK